MFLSFICSLLMFCHQVRRKRDEMKIRVLFFVGYDSGPYGVIYTDIFLPLYFLLFTSISNFTINEVKYTSRMVDSMTNDNILPAQVAQISSLDLFIFTQIHLFSTSINGDVLPSLLLDTLYEEIDAINQLVRSEDDDDTSYAVITYSLGVYAYQHVFASLDKRIQEQMVYEGFVGSATLLGRLFKWTIVRNRSVFRHIIGSSYDFLSDHQNMIKYDDNVLVTNLWHYYPVSFISRLLVHLMILVDPIGLYSIVRQVGRTSKLRGFKNPCFFF
jgi:hypothetical protein